jgi:HlyD family secretion protein
MIKNLLAGAGALCLIGCTARAAGPEGFPGIVEFEQREVAFEVAGRITAVSVRRGDVIQNGAVLATLDDTIEKLTIDARMHEVDAAKAELALLEAGPRVQDVASLAAQLGAARKSEASLKKASERAHALNSAGALAQSDLDKTDADLARATGERQSLEQRLTSLRLGARDQELARAKARVASALAAVALENERLSRHTLRAHGAATVLDVHVDPGELASVGTSLATLADTAHPYVDVFVPQGQLGGIQVGRRASLRVDASKAPFSGMVEHIAPKTEFTPRFFFSERERPNLVVRVRVRLDDPERRMHAGVPAFVTFER